MANEVQKYKNTGLEYIRGTNRTIFNRNGVVVLNADFDDWDKKGVVLAQVLGLAGKPEHSGFDFNHVRKTGQLQRLVRNAVVEDDENEPEIAHAPIPSAPPPLSNAAPVPGAVTYDPIPETVEGPSLAVEVAEEIADLPVIETKPARVYPWAKLFRAASDRIEAHHTARLAEITEATVEVEAEKKSAHNSPLLMLVVIIIVGLGAMVMSAYHIITYMHDGGRAAWIATVTGCIMTLFSAIAFTAGRHFFERNKGARFFSRLPGYLIGSAFTMFGIIVIFFAMFSTIKVNFDQFQAGDAAKTVTVVSTSTKVTDAGKRATLVQSELDRLDAAIKKDQAEIDSWTRAWKAEAAKGKASDPDLAWQNWSKVAKATKAKEAHETERAPFVAEAMNKQNDVSSVEETVKTAVEDATVFGMFASLFKIPVETMKFIVYVIPAVFYDLMCPFALTISFMLADERNRTRRKSKVVS